MSILTLLAQQLSTQFAQMTANQGIVCLQASQPFYDEASEQLALLGWLKAQTHAFPHYYLQHRTEQRILLGVGEMRRFSLAEAAQQFSDETHFTLLGRIGFHGAGEFILPRLMLEQTAEKLTAWLYVDSHQLAEEAVNLAPYFANFDKISPLELAPNAPIAQHNAMEFNQWQAQIQRATEAIATHQFSKVVLANAFALEFSSPISAYDLLAKSLKINVGCYQFLWADSADSAFVGATPERLYARTGRELFTEALAGTVAVTENAEETQANAQWLLQDQKNQIENQLVVEDISAHLANSVCQIQIGQAEIKRLNHVQHLRRPIQATLNAGVSDMQCLQSLHPTAAIAGLPRMAAKAFIAQAEPFERGWYAGALGFFSPQAGEFCVTLRSAQIHQNQLTLYAGAGIVAGSQPEAEWQEIERKSQAIAKLLTA